MNVRYFNIQITLTNMLVTFKYRAQYVLLYCIQKKLLPVPSICTVIRSLSTFIKLKVVCLFLPMLFCNHSKWLQTKYVAAAHKLVYITLLLKWFADHNIFDHQGGESIKHHRLWDHGGLSLGASVILSWGLDRVIT